MDFGFLKAHNSLRLHAYLSNCCHGQLIAEFLDSEVSPFFATLLGLLALWHVHVSLVIKNATKYLNIYAEWYTCDLHTHIHKYSRMHIGDAVVGVTWAVITLIPYGDAGDATFIDRATLAVATFICRTILVSLSRCGASFIFIGYALHLNLCATERAVTSVVNVFMPSTALELSPPRYTLPYHSLSLSQSNALSALHSGALCSRCTRLVIHLMFFLLFLSAW